MIEQLSPTLGARFWGHAPIGRPDDCWEWRGVRTNSGYGVLSVGTGVTRGAHQIMWYLMYGEVPEVVMHECDNRGCVNPRHLSAGDHSRNNQDTVTKRRRPLGQRHHNATIPDSEINGLRTKRAAGATLRELAEHYDVSPSTISNIYRGLTRVKTLPAEHSGVAPPANKA